MIVLAELLEAAWARAPACRRVAERDEILRAAFGPPARATALGDIRNLTPSSSAAH
jgi:hypothetical protein